MACENRFVRAAQTRQEAAGAHIVLCDEESSMAEKMSPPLSSSFKCWVVEVKGKGVGYGQFFFIFFCSRLLTVVQY